MALIRKVKFLKVAKQVSTGAGNQTSVCQIAKLVTLILYIASSTVNSIRQVPIREISARCKGLTPAF